MMKNLLLTAILLSIFSMKITAQVSLNFIPLTTSAEVGETVTIAVEATGMTNISGFQIGMEWDSTILKTVDSSDPVSNVNSQFGIAWEASQQISGQFVEDTLSFIWLDLSPKDFTGVLYEISFVVQAVGTTSLYFTGTEIIDGSLQELTVVTDTATITGTSPVANPLQLSVEMVSADAGMSACAEVAVAGGFMDITTLDFSLNWDNTIAGYTNTMSLNSALSTATFNTSQTGKLGFEFSTATGVNLAVGDVLFNVCFDADGTEGTSTPIDFEDLPVAIMVENGAGSVGHNFSDGSFSVGTPDTIFLYFTPSTTSAEVGSTVVMTVAAMGSNEIATIQLGFGWDESIIHTLDSSNPVINVNPIFNEGEGYFANQEVLGQIVEDTLAFVWLEPAGHSLSGTLFEIPFVIQAEGTTDLYFTGTEIYSSIPEQYIVVTDTAQITGLPATNGNPLKLSVETVSADMGATECVEVSVVSDFTDITILDFSLAWDNSIAGFSNTMSLNTALSSATFNTSQTGKLGFEFNSGTGVDLPIGEVLFSVCYSADGASASSTPISFGDNPSPINITNSSGVISNVFTNGSFSINNSGGALVLTIPDTTGLIGTNVCVPVTTENFTDIGLVSFSLTWDTSIIEYTNTIVIDKPGTSSPVGNLNEDSVAVGNLGYIFFSVLAPPVTLPFGAELLNVCFDVVGEIGESSPITFTDDPIGFSANNSNGNVVMDTTSGSLTIPNPNININANVMNLSCNATNDGMIELTPTGGTGAYAYQWTGPGGPHTGASLSGLGAGSYSVTVTSGSATETETFMLTESGFTLSLVTLINETDPPNGNGSIEVLPSGTSNYSYTWTGPGSPFANSAMIQDLVAGFYTVVVTDDDACTATMTLEIKKLEVSGNFINPSCNGDNNGSVTLDVSGGTTPYSYQWTMGLNGPAPAGLEAGSYTVTVSDATNAEVVLIFDLVDPAAINIQLVGITNEDPGMTNGAVDITASGGTGSLSYLWTGNSTDEDLNGVIAGVYFVTVTDANTCSEVGGPYNVIITGTPEATYSVDSVNCKGESSGSITITAINGGTAPYTITGIGSPQSSLPIVYDNLLAGSYDLIITDDNMESTNMTIEVFEPEELLISNIVITPSSGNDGAINYTVSGGSEAYDFDWSDDAFDGQEDISSLAAGTYELIITDVNGCTVTESFVVLLEGMPIPTYTTQDVLCKGDNTGAITITAITGSTAPYTVTGIGSSQSSLPIVYDNLLAGSYDLVITDANNLITNFTAQVGEPSDILQISNIDITPSSGSDGAINYTVSGGTTEYSFDWDDDTYDGQMNLNNLSFGTYVLIVTDGNGCTITESFTVMNSAMPMPTYTIEDVNCNGNNTGVITITAIEGGMAPYIVTGIGSPQSNLPIVYNNLSAGNYDLVITDANSQVTNFTAQVDEPAEALVISDIVITPSSGNNGSIIYSLTGGTPDYTYDWDHDAYDNLQDIFGLLPEDYSVIITDANGCVISHTFVVPEASLPVPTVTTIPTDCFSGSDGVITINAIVGGLPNYTISLSGESDLITDGTQSVMFTNLEAGAYTLTITDDIGSEMTYVANVNEPDQIQIAVVEVINEILPTGNNGSISVNVTGGTGDYTFEWDPNGQTIEDISNLSAGTYELEVVDENGCKRTSEPIVVNQESEEFNCATNPTDTDCPQSTNGSVQLNIVGGAFPLTAVWKKDNSLDTFATSFNLMNLGPGSYTVTVKDATGAISTCTAVVGQESSLSGVLDILSSYNGYGVSGFGVENGKAKATASLGITPYSYLWSSGETNDNATSLAGGVISVTITDGAECEIILSDNLTEPDEMSCSTNAIDTPCSDSFEGAVDLSVNGGVTAMNYTYAWTGPNDFESSNKDLNDLTSGIYLVTITDANGNSTACDATVGVASNMELTIEHISNYNGYDLPTPDALVGEANADVVGGEAPYTFIWSNGSTTQQPDTLPAGLISVTVTDAFGCTIEANTVMTAPGAFFCNVETTNTICPGVSEGTATVILSGGVMPVAGYFWTGPGDPPTDSMILNLAQGTYDITVTDANGVTTSCSGIVGQESHLEASVQIGPFASTTTAADGQAKAIPTGGVTPYTYNWSSGETTATAMLIPGGSASVTVTDGLGCTTKTTFIMPIIGVLVGSFDVQDATCFGVCNGEVSISIAGGTGPYSYAWDGGQNEKSVDGICNGDYAVTVTDLNGLTGAFTATIGEPDSLHIEFNITNPSDQNSSDGSVVATVSGGTPGYVYNWNEGTATANLSGKGIGDYILIVADANNCTKMGSVTLEASIADNCFVAPEILTPGVLDGSNDVFDITCLNSSTENKLTIFSRWGQLVYQNNDYLGDWKGVDDSDTDLPDGAYFWVLKYNINGESFEKKGHVTIIR